MFKRNAVFRPSPRLIALCLFLLCLFWLQRKPSETETSVDVATDVVPSPASLSAPPASASPSAIADALPVPTVPAAPVGGHFPQIDLAPEAVYAVNDPQGVLSPIVGLVANGKELARRELPVDARGRPGRLRLMRADSFKYPLLRVEERFGLFENGMINPFPEILVSVADHVMAQFPRDWDAAKIEAALIPLGARVRERLLVPGLVLVELPEPSLDAVPEAIRDYPALAGARFAEADWLVGHMQGLVPNDPEFPALWGMPKISAPQAWEVSSGRSRVVVAVIDSGVDYTHPDLAANIFYNSAETANSLDSDGNGFVDDIRGWDFYDNNNNPMDENRHGTHVSGTIAAAGDNGMGVVGVSWRSRILPVRFLNASGAGSFSGAINSIAYSTLMGVEISNNSWGGGTFSQALYDVIAEARDAGILFVAAAGNAGAADPGFPARYGHAGSHLEGNPALDNVISVMASNNNAEDSIASFSNLNGHLSAPGVGIYSTTLGKGYEPLDGTSMAAPHVAGAAALLFGVMIEPDYLAVRNQLFGSVDDRSSDSKYDLYVNTKGRLNVNQALRTLNAPIIALTGQSIVDQNGPRAGNFIAEPGETIELTLDMRSMGQVNVQNVSATLSSNSPYVSVTSGATRSYGSFAYLETRANAAPYVLTLAPGTPTPHAAELSLVITSDQATWTEVVTLMVYTSVDVSGRVLHLNGAPFAGATVTYNGPFSGSAESDAQGNYSFEMVDGVYQFFAEAPGYRRSPVRHYNAPPGTTGMDFVLGNTVLTASHPVINAQARPGGRVEIQVELSNSGNMPSDWSLAEPSYGSEFVLNGLTDPARPELHWKEIRAEHGGTGRRISWWELNNPDKVIEGQTGAQVGWSGTVHWSSGPFSFPFEFPFYGQRFSSARINSAGWLSFTSINRSVTYAPYAPLPNEGFADNKIAFQWSVRSFGSSDLAGPTHKKPNLDPWHSLSGFGDTQHAYSKSLDDYSWVFTWNQWANTFVRTPAEFDTGQVELRSDGTVIVRYLDYQKLPGVTNFTYGGPYFFSAGLQDGTTTRGINPVFRGSTPANPLPGSVLIMRPEVLAGWIEPDRLSGRVEAVNGSQILQLTLNAAQLPPGVYRSSIVIRSEDSANGVMTIPITFNVAENVPSLVLTAPSTDLEADPGDDLPLRAEFSGLGTVDGDVRFYAGDELLGLGALNAGGYEYLWGNMPGGYHEIFAQARIAESGFTVASPVRLVRAGKGLRVRLENVDVNTYSPSLIAGEAAPLRPTVISRTRARAERYDLTPVALDPGQFSWWGSTATRDPDGRTGFLNVGNHRQEVRLVTFNFQKHPLAYTVTPNTVMEFEFRVFDTVGGDDDAFVYGIGLAASDTVAQNRVFRVHGKRNWGIANFAGIYPYNLGLQQARRPWIRYRIPVGQFYTGAMQHLVFVQEHGYNVYFRDMDAAYRNIKLYESGESTAYDYTWTFNDSDRVAHGETLERTYFSPGTKEIRVTVNDGPHSGQARRSLELPGQEAFLVAVSFQPMDVETPAGFVRDCGEIFGGRDNDLRYGWNSSLVHQTRNDNWFISFNSPQAVSRIRAGNGATWEMEVPNGVYQVIGHVGASEESTKNLLRFNGVELINRNLEPHARAEGSLTLPVSNGRIVISSHSNTASLLYLQISRVADVELPPVASFFFTPQSGDAPLPVSFDASTSFGNGDAIVSYLWDFGDGFQGSGVSPVHSYTQPGHYAVTLRVTDEQGLSHDSTQTVHVTGDAQPALRVTPPYLPPAPPPFFGEPQPAPRRELGEGGAPLGCSLVLATPPAAEVTVTLGGGPRVSFSPASLVFTPANWNQPRVVEIQAVDNEEVDGEETALVTAATASTDPAYHGLTGASFEVYVLDNDAYGTLQFTSSALSVSEAAGNAAVWVRRVGGQSGHLSAHFSTANGSALSGSDYSAVSGTLTWAHNDTADKSIQIPILDDSDAEAPETFQVRLDSATNAHGDTVLGSPSTLTVTILDNDNTAPSILLQSPANGATFEAGDVVTLSAEVISLSSSIASVQFRINGATVATLAQPVSGNLYSISWIASIGAVNWSVVATDTAMDSSTSETRNLTVTPVPNLGNGGFLREIFYNVTGDNVSNLTGSATYPDEPDSFAFIQTGTLEYLENTNSYGTRLRAYFVAPKTGNYHFYLAARRRAELWLSTDDQPANRVRILNPNREDNPNSWGNAAQKSAAIPLVAGQRYYLEALHKAATSGTRHIQVGVELPGGQLERPIPVAFLQPFNGVKLRPSTQLLRVSEGGQAAFQVRLSHAPVDTVTVTVDTRNFVSGGESLEIIQGQQLTFTPENWDQDQSIALAAAVDSDALDGQALVRMTLDNGSFWEISAMEIDAQLNHAPTVAILSPSVASVNLPAGVGLLLEADAVDLDNDPLSVLWERISGPGTVTFDDASALETGARFSAVGDYLLRVTVNDGEYSVNAAVTVRVNPAAVTQANITTTRGGSHSIEGQNWTFAGGGAGLGLNVAGAEDSIRFAYAEITGDFDVSGRLASFTGRDWSFSGLHVRNSLASNSRHFTGGVYRNGSTWSGTVRRRLTDGGSTTGGENLAGTSTHGWVRITRVGYTFRAFHSTDGVSWTERISSSITMNDTVLVGIIVDNENDSTTLSTASWTNVSIPATVNLAPLVNAGPDATVDLADSHTLAASFSGVYQPHGAFSTQWTKISGPGLVYANPAPPTAPDASITFELPGTYVLRYRVSNGEATTFDDVTITVAGSAYDVWARQLPLGQRAKDHVYGGVPNLLRYALGGDISAPSSAFRLLAQGHSNGMDLSFPRINDPQLSYEIWGSEDLVDWGQSPVWSGTGDGSTAFTLVTPGPLWFLHLRVRHLP